MSQSSQRRVIYFPRWLELTWAGTAQVFGECSETARLVLVLFCFLGHEDVSLALCVRGVATRKRWTDSGGIADVAPGLHSPLVPLIANTNAFRFIRDELRLKGAISTSSSDTFRVNSVWRARILAAVPDELHCFWRLVALLFASHTIPWEFLEPDFRPTDMSTEVAHFHHTLLEVQNNEGYSVLDRNMKTEVISSLLEATRFTGTEGHIFAVAQSKMLIDGLNVRYLQCCVLQFVSFENTSSWANFSVIEEDYTSHGQTSKDQNGSLVSKRASTSQQTDPDLFCNIGSTLIELDDFKFAESQLRGEAMKEAEANNAIEPLLHLILAESIFAQGRFSEVEGICQEVQSQADLSNREELHVSILLAKISHVRSEWNDAFYHWSEALRTIEKSTPFHDHIARVILRSLCDVVHRQGRHNLRRKFEAKLSALGDTVLLVRGRHWITGLNLWQDGLPGSLTYMHLQVLAAKLPLQPSL
ncbi:hypothetical protein MGYG_02254 [Nannizzia gypsea CBS 118893]|uniref:Uncharacterized protein n=1 Tax=Arthroderma gypseum (strain ATCC MYA-4604 / CBS 118893) TaxID=535722 RepID=E4UQL2_ARTGP|nr:hypothetical protein MGYG_02254 [Nannizzia gypsea CBS 118893]EFQ99241.1 hypothetical protein MGYG_02254 [Nannizzia gypsea CBS 118893]